MTAAAEARSSRTPWLVRAGHGAEHVERFVDGGFVSISWARIPHLGDLRDHDDDEILGLLRAAGRGQPAADLRELIDFRDGIAVGDAVVTVDTPARDVLLGEVTGGYEYQPTPVVGDHRHLRQVHWLGRWPRELLDEPLGYTLRYYQRTVLELPHADAWLALAERVGAGDGAPPEQRRRGRRQSGAQPATEAAARHVRLLRQEQMGSELAGALETSESEWLDADLG